MVRLSLVSARKVVAAAFMLVLALAGFVVWRASREDASALRRSNEDARLELSRRVGWDVIQSNDFILKQEGDHVSLAGTGQGHGIGLCQAGAKAMAREGASFRQILSHYYPNATVVSFAPNVAAAH